MRRTSQHIKGIENMSIEINLEGKVAVVTGAGRGIGKSVAVVMAQAGADVVLAARTASQLDETAKEVRSMGQRALCLPTDVSQKSEVEKLMTAAVEELGGLHILVNNAGIVVPAPLFEMKEEDWDRVLAINLKSMFLCTQAAGRYMAKQKYGKIVNMASTGGIVARPNNASYHASKAAVIHFTKATAIEWIRYNINVNSIGPGTTDTELLDEFLQNSPREKTIKGIPIRRLADCMEVANIALFLASDLSSYLVGENIIVDGGLTIP